MARKCLAMFAPTKTRTYHVAVPIVDERTRRLQQLSAVRESPGVLPDFGGLCVRFTFLCFERIKTKKPFFPDAFSLTRLKKRLSLRMATALF